MNLFLRLKRYSPGPAAYLFGVVFLLRVLALARLTSSPFLLPAQGDMHFYNDWAQRILAGQFTDHLAFYGLPLYAYGLALLYKVFGYNPFIPGFLQAVLEAGTAVLIYRIAIRVLAKSRTPNDLSIRQIEGLALVAGLGWGVFVPAEAFAVILMPTVWLIFVFWLVVWRIVRTDNAPNRTEFLVLGLLLGVTAMAVATILFLAPLLVAASFKIWGPEDGSPWRRRTTAAALLLCGIVAGTSPCWIHNYFVARDPVFLSAHSGINFWIGNNPDANGYPRFPPGLHAGQAAMLQDSITAAEAAAGHSLKRSDVSHFWSSKARSYITSHPTEWLRLLRTKFCNFWSAFRYDDLSIITSLREHHVILPGFYFGLAAAFGIPGMLLAWRRSPVARWVIAAILLHMVALLPVFVTERYRLPIVPGLLVCAVFGLTAFWQSLVLAQYSRAAIYLCLLGLVVTLVSWPQPSPALWALDPYNSGIQALELGRESLDRNQREAAATNFTVANRKLEMAFAYAPDNAELNFALGELRQVEGQTAQAKSFYAATLQIDPRHERAFNNLGILALAEQRYPLAQSFFRHALEVDPKNGKTHFLMAKTLVATGQRESAQREIDTAIGLNPNQSEFRELRDQMTRQPASP